MIKASLSEAFANAPGEYFDNDLGDFTNPHSHAMDKENCVHLVDILEHMNKELL